MMVKELVSVMMVMEVEKMIEVETVVLVKVLMGVGMDMIMKVG